MFWLSSRIVLMVSLRVYFSIYQFKQRFVSTYVLVRFRKTVDDKFLCFLYLYIDQFKHVLCEYLCFVELRNNLTVSS